ncbi:hypothetical protein SEA_THYATIRA_82 [Mycobacterium phage Thyatira]|uniref:Uncharacterized protein n=1 Tax=Mycobacterium phage Thyatira TaxID=2283261 RepID=A0A345M9A9_9CAUD|nr:hypothetical protein I5G76_gp19 [Mycobacterium phage Thyatira]AXH67080.1 hypothetical protein SEA_THYATIRA_82 [Mycobacterium phage Thyatira]
MGKHSMDMHITAENGSVAALNVGAVHIGRPAGIDGATGTVLDGLKPIGRISEDGIDIKCDDGPDLEAFGGEKLRTLQDRRDISFSINLEHVDPAAWHAVLGVPLRPAPTLRSATVDACDALCTLLRILLHTLHGEFRARRRGLADALVWWRVDPLADRVDALACYPWRRLPGPVFRLWDSEFTHLHTEHGQPEPLRTWLRRCVRHTWKALRHG